MSWESYAKASNLLSLLYLIVIYGIIIVLVYYDLLNRKMLLIILAAHQISHKLRGVIANCILVICIWSGLFQNWLYPLSAKRCKSWKTIHYILILIQISQRTASITLSANVVYFLVLCRCPFSQLCLVKMPVTNLYSASSSSTWEANFLEYLDKYCLQWCCAACTSHSFRWALWLPVMVYHIMVRVGCAVALLLFCQVHWHF